jgi:hypothetical protein
MRAILFAVVLSAVTFAGSLFAAPLTVRTHSGAGAIDLAGGDDRRQVLVIEGEHRDRTREVRYSLAPEGIARIDSSGWIEPLADGAADLTVTPPEPGAAPAHRAGLGEKREDDPPAQLSE